MSLKVSIEQNGSDVHLIFAGSLDEDCQLPRFAEPLRGRLTIDLADLETLNSLGCRKWVMWIKDTAGARGGVRLLNCSPAVINQVNVLSGFVPETVEVDSFFVPYTCENCGHEERVLLSRGEEFGDVKLSVADEMPCHKCGGILSMDVVRERYFRFLNKLKSA